MTVFGGSSAGVSPSLVPDRRRRRRAPGVLRARVLVGGVGVVGVAHLGAVALGRVRRSSLVGLLAGLLLAPAASSAACFLAGCASACCLRRRPCVVGLLAVVGRLLGRRRRVAVGARGRRGIALAVALAIGPGHRLLRPPPPPRPRRPRRRRRRAAPAASSLAASRTSSGSAVRSSASSATVMSGPSADSAVGSGAWNSTDGAPAPRLGLFGGHRFDARDGGDRVLRGGVLLALRVGRSGPGRRVGSSADEAVLVPAPSSVSSAIRALLWCRGPWPAPTPAPASRDGRCWRFGDCRRRGFRLSCRCRASARVLHSASGRASSVTRPRPHGGGCGGPCRSGRSS